MNTSIITSACVAFCALTLLSPGNTRAGWRGNNPTVDEHDGPHLVAVKGKKTDKEQRGAADDTDRSNSAGDCGRKRKCNDMSSCAEARHYLTDCGVHTLDRDGDGIPCESLCKKGR